jgi:hydroxypyruvate isomerase
MENEINRRGMLKKATAATIALTSLSFTESMGAIDTAGGAELKGRINHSACRWCYQTVPFEELVKTAKGYGMQSIELTGPTEWEVLKKYGLTSAMGWPEKWPEGLGLTNCFNTLKNHDILVALYEDLIPKAAAAGVKNLITFSGNKNGLSDEQGLLNCKKGLQRIMKTAEKHDVTITMELLNSRVDHKDYQCDNTEWGAVLCEMVGSNKFKLLYDIYHMQIMEGDLIATIKRNQQYISHYHTGGVPGRHEINDSQEINYPAVMKAILETGYKGFVGQEFIPTMPDKLAALKQGITICDV